jgi:argininosuccinate lyase
MPQKKNLGAVELLRGRAQVMLAYQQQILGVLSGLPSGYNMDSQDTKKPFMDALDLAAQSAAVAALFVSQIEPDEEKMIEACSPELFATDIAYDMVRGGTPFRDAYRKVAGMIADLPGKDPQEHLQHRSHQGTHGDLRLEVSEAEINRREAQIDAREQELAGIKNGLLSGERIDGTGNR